MLSNGHVRFGYNYLLLSLLFSATKNDFDLRSVIRETTTTTLSKSPRTPKVSESGSSSSDGQEASGEGKKRVTRLSESGGENEEQVLLVVEGLGHHTPPSLRDQYFTASAPSRRSTTTSP